MIKFQKYEGTGNDFVMVNNLEGNISLSKEEIIKICDRHFGVGADGVILLEKSSRADCFMNYINSDGSFAEMCGNGSRCTADFFAKETNSNKKEITLETRAGIKIIKINEDNTYSVNMGVPILESPDFPNKTEVIEGFDFNFVSMGNPHAITFVKGIENLDFKTIGKKVENNPLFPNKINVEFAEKVEDSYYKVKVWERGCGATLACGTGACAVYSTIKNSDKTFSKSFMFDEITLEFPGGKLFLSENNNGEIILRGPATFVFNGEI